MSDELRTDAAAWEAASDQDYLEFERELATATRTDTITASLNQSIEQNAEVWRELAGECTATGVSRGNDMKRIGKRADGMVEALLTPDEYESVRELPPPPRCMICVEPSPHLMHIGYGSKHDGDWICPDCLDVSIDYMDGRKGGE